MIPLVLLMALFIVVVFIGRPYTVNGSSMEPTLHSGDRVFVVKYRMNTTPDRGDVVVLKNAAKSPEMLIKRVVAIAGDRITLEKEKIVVNGRYVYKSTGWNTTASYTRLVPDGHLFVMGDNESRSYDSRVFGPVKQSHVVGKALFVFWPFGDIKVL